MMTFLHSSSLKENSNITSKLLNLMEGENLADDLNDAKATESAEKEEAE